jgi:hypothetical protein
MSDRKGESDRYCGVNGISAGFQDRFTGVGRVRFASHHHAMLRVNRLPCRESWSQTKQGEKSTELAHRVLSHPPDWINSW